MMIRTRARVENYLFVCLLVLALSAGITDAYAEVEIVYAFKGGTDGLGPSSSVVFDGQGNLYGTTGSGGGIGCRGWGCGTVYRISPTGHETLLYSFKGRDDGVGPEGLVRGEDGTLYGTTATGGGRNKDCLEGCGTVFKLAPDGTVTVLHTFAPHRNSNAAPGLLVDKSGNIYGANATEAYGMVYRIAPDGTFSVLHWFCSLPGCADGEGPNSPLIADGAGNLYGTTGGGGSKANGGTVFKLAPDGALTVLYTFCATSCGWEPNAGLTMDQTGTLYGTTAGGGIGCQEDGGCGTVFAFAPDGTERVVHKFRAIIDGYRPGAGVTLTVTDNLCGATQTRAFGAVVYCLAPDGNETLEHFSTGVAAGLTERNGMLYGAASAYGDFRYPAGFIFAVTEPEQMH